VIVAGDITIVSVALLYYPCVQVGVSLLIFVAMRSVLMRFHFQPAALLVAGSGMQPPA